MSSTTFVDGTTPIVASWLNDVNRLTYTGVFPSGSSFAATSVPYTPPGTGAVATTVAARLSDFVIPQNFGALANGINDDSASIVLAATYAAANNRPLLFTGNYGINKLTLTGINGLTIHWDATFTGIASTTQTCVVEFLTCSNIYATGNLNINGNYNTNYTVGLWIHSPTASQFMNLSNISVGGCKIAYRFGDPSYVDAIISEITMNGGHTFGCPSICDLYGTQTLVSVHGVNWSADFGSGSGSWLTLPTVGVSVNGSYISFHGGEVLMTSITGGVLFESKPITSISYDNRYGSILVNGSTVETASPLARAVNPNSVAVAAGTGNLNFQSCTGFHSQNLAAFISTNLDYTGLVKVKNNKFFCSVARTGSNYNISCSGNAIVDCDENSFYTNFMPWISGISGGVVRGQNGMMLYKNASQAIAAASWVQITASGAANQGLRGGSVGSSNFTAPMYGIYHIEFGAYGSSSTVASSFTVAIYLNGSIIIAGESNYSTAVNLPVSSRASATLVLNTNDIVTFYAQASGANFTVCNALGNCTFEVTQIH